MTPVGTTTLEDSLRDLVRDVVREEVTRALAERDTPAEYLTVAQAADVARVARGTVRRWVREGRLADHRAGRVVRVRRNELDHLMRGQRRGDGLTPEQQADLDFERRR